MPLPSLPALLFTALALLAAPSARAALAAVEDPSSSAPPTAQALQPPPDDAELGTFVSAFVRLIGVQHGYMVMLRDERDPTRIEEMKQHALEDMTNAVQQQGMTVERYNAIASALENDPGLQGRVEAILRQMASSEDEGDQGNGPGQGNGGE